MEDVPGFGGWKSGFANIDFHSNGSDDEVSSDVD